MSAYRTPGGARCPRCETPLLRERDDELVCNDGCGTWLGNARLPFDPAALVSLSAIHPPLDATALPFTRCLECNRSLTDLYKGVVDVLAIGQCLEHGVWIERGDRAMFDARYAEELRTHAAEQRAREAAQAEERAAQERAEAAQAHLASLPPEVADLVMRVATLERTVTAMARELAELRARVRET